MNNELLEIYEDLYEAFTSQIDSKMFKVAIKNSLDYAYQIGKADALYAKYIQEHEGDHNNE